MRYITYYFLLASLFAQTQNQKLGVVLDSDTKKPVEFVDVYNAYDVTHTNEDGQFFILTNSDSLNFRKIGYTPRKVSFATLQDTIFLEPKLFELEEVILTNMKTLWSKVGDSLASNYRLSPFKERFFLRCLLRKNGQLTRVQDIAGKLGRKTQFYKKGMDFGKKDFEFEITQMRKVGIDSDENEVYFTFFSLSKLFFESLRLNATGEGFELTEKMFEGEPMAKILFQSTADNPAVKTHGHYVINKANNAIESVVIHTDIDTDNFSKDGHIRSRATKRDQIVHFSKSKKKDRYFMSSAKLAFEIEISSTKEDFKDGYTSEYIIQLYDHDGDFDFKANTNAKKDIFKLKADYDEKFWEKQHFLPLTNEIKNFISTMGSKNKTFKVRSNL